MIRIPSLLSCALSVGALAASAAFAAPPASPAPPATAAAPAATAAPAAKPAAGSTMSEADKTVYAIGVILSGSVKPFALTDHEARLVREGFDAGLHGTNSAVDTDQYRPQIQAMLTERMGKAVAASKSAGQSYREKAATAKDTTTLPSGVIVTKVKAGSGPSPTAEDQVKVNYEGRLIDGTVFDASSQHGQPLTFKVSGVVPCWSEALQQMSVGAKIKLVCPPEQAYGDRGSPPKIPGGSTLVFDVELLAIEKAPPAPATPAAPAATEPPKQ